jgi:hypothetical protein
MQTRVYDAQEGAQVATPAGVTSFTPADTLAADAATDAPALGTVAAGHPAAAAAAGATNGRRKRNHGSGPAAAAVAAAPVNSGQLLADALILRLDSLLAELAVWHEGPAGAVGEALEILDDTAARELPALSGAVRTWEDAGVFGGAVFGPEAVPSDASGEELEEHGAELFALLRAARVPAVRDAETGARDAAATTLLNALAVAAHRRKQPAPAPTPAPKKTRGGRRAATAGAGK